MKTPDLKDCREKLGGIDREILRLVEDRKAVKLSGGAAGHSRLGLIPFLHELFCASRRI